MKAAGPSAEPAPETLTGSHPSCSELLSHVIVPPGWMSLLGAVVGWLGLLVHNEGLWKACTKEPTCLRRARAAGVSAATSAYRALDRAAQLGGAASVAAEFRASRAACA